MEPIALKSGPPDDAASPSPGLREVLRAYQGVLDDVENLPPCPLILRRHGSRPHYFPRYRWLVRYFAVRHIDRALLCLTRRYSARAALGWAEADEVQDRQAVQQFQQSLPPIHRRVYLIVLVAAVVLIIRPISNLVIPLAQKLTATALPSKEIRKDVQESIDKLESALSADFASVDDAVRAVFFGGWLHAVVVALGIGLSLYVALRPLVPALQLKRMLFNLAPDLPSHRKSAVARWSTQQSTGLYSAERRLFSTLDGRAPDEFPFDLAVSALGTTFPLLLSSAFIRFGIDIPESRPMALSLAGCMLIATAVRLAWLHKTWQRRKHVCIRPVTPYEVGIHHGTSAATVERAVGVRLLFFILLFAFVTGFAIDDSDPTTPPTSIRTALQIGYLAATVLWLMASVGWWYRTNRELRNLDRAYDIRKPRTRPYVLLLLLLGGWLFLPVIYVYRQCSHIRRAQARAGLPQPLRLPWLWPLGLFVAPVLISAMQHELNKLWSCEGFLLDPWATSEFQSAPSVASLPWIRTAADVLRSTVSHPL